ncbi:MAG: class I SAM-dependent methyltransferase [Ktedonobacteraceae bacterium]|nr:class I SAM-dependent methyltransferase [Ktedonobacteraceae bacterium]
MSNDNTHLPEHVRKNKAMWEATSDTYEKLHADALAGENALTWGLWRIPEAELNVLGEVAHKDVLEFGCGAARWSIALAQQGARPVGLDISSQQLSHARRLMAEAGLEFPLVEASAEAVPLPDASFDIVFCDWGAMTFTDPYKSVPEAARLLRPGGLFAFCGATPIQFICSDVKTDRVERHLINDYFGLTHLDWGDSIDFQIPYGEWIRLFRRNHLLIEDLIETRPAPGAASTYRTGEENEWARHWPMESIWKVRKESSIL